MARLQCRSGQRYTTASAWLSSSLPGAFSSLGSWKYLRIERALTFSLVVFRLDPLLQTPCYYFQALKITLATRSLLDTPLSFFETNPILRYLVFYLLERTSKDLGSDVGIVREQKARLDSLAVGRQKLTLYR